MDKAFIIQEIKRTSEDGKPLGKLRFRNETGIKESDWYGKHWTRWNEAVIEAGFNPNEKQLPSSTEFLLKSLANLASELGKFPTTGDLRIKAYNSSDFPSHNTFKRFGNKSNLAQTLLKYATENDLENIIPLCMPEISEKVEKNDNSEAGEFGIVYLYKSGSHYKIGRTNSLTRRNREIQLQLPIQAELIHRISTDDPIGIERYWHERFSEKRLNGEWFKLNSQDIKAFGRRKFM